MTRFTPPATAQFPKRGRQGESSPKNPGDSPVLWHAIGWMAVLLSASVTVGIFYLVCQGLAELGVGQ